MPVLTRAEKADEDYTKNSSVLSHCEPVVNNHTGYTPAINFKKSYITSSTAHRKSSLMQRSSSSSSSSSSQEDANNLEKSFEENVAEIDPARQQETIGETLFESTNLKGCKKTFYLYLFMIACLRFMCFRTKKPTRYAPLFVLMFISIILFDMVVTFNLFLHMKTESEDEKVFSGIGIYYFFLYPGIAIIAPICGLISQFI